MKTLKEHHNIAYYCSFCGERNLLKIDPGGGSPQHKTTTCRHCSKSNTLRLEMKRDTVKVDAQTDVWTCKPAEDPEK